MVKQTLAGLAFLFLMCLPLQAQTIPKQDIIGVQAEYTAGDMVILSVSGIPEKPKYLIDVNYSWLVLNCDGTPKSSVMVWPDKTQIFFSVGVAKKPTSYTVVLAISYTYEIKDEKGVTTDIKTVLAPQKAVKLKVKGLDPEPDPPGPNPNPSPVFPDGKYQLSKFIFDTVNNKTITNKARGATALANSFKAIDAQIAAGTLKTYQDALKQTQLSNQSAISKDGSSLVEWDSVFLALQDKLYDLYTTNKMTTLADLRVAWTELAAGLVAVK